MGILLKIIMYTWQLPQMLIAWFWYGINKKKVLNTFKNHAYIVYKGIFKGGMTLGDRIFINDRYHGDYLNLVVAHESGHVKQSKILGPLYLFIIGIPSIVWAATHKRIAPNKSYYWFYTESIANKLGGVAVNQDGTLTWAHLVNKE